MHIWLIRHGQSQWQLDPSLDRDSALTELGKIQSCYLSNYIHKRIKEDQIHPAIYTSPLKRALQTAHPLGLIYSIRPEIQEASFHVASCLPTSSKPKIFPRTLSSEPLYQQFKVTIKAFLEEIMKTHKYNHSFLYTHGGVIKTFLRIIHDSDNICYQINNCSLTEIIWHRQRWHIKALNNHAFIPSKYVT